DDDAVIELLEKSREEASEATTNGNENGQELATKKMIKEEKICSIFADVVQLSKEKVYAFFPTGIGVHTRQRQEKTVFSYVTSRDKLLQFLRHHWENYSEVDEDFCSSVQGSSIDEGPLDGGQASSREASVLNDEDSGILVTPSMATSASAAGRPAASAAAAVGSSSAVSAVDSTTSASGPTESSASGDEAAADERGFYADRRPQPSPGRSSRSRWQSLLADWDRLPNRHALTVIAFFVLLCAIVIVYLSYRLNSLQQQLLLVVSMRSGHGQSEVDHLNYRLGSIVETLGGLQEKLGSLRHLLHNLRPADNR
uniref:GRAM domain-containing protein n=1 Tax=Macrostomum lignano TaxID=282301 RepID=A0A1I8IJA7_9PLAT